MVGHPYGRVAVIAGGSRGIGLATAVLFAGRGWRVGLIARGQAGLVEAAGRIRAAGGEVATAQADVADVEALERAADALEESLGPVALWVNAACSRVRAAFAEMEPEEFRRVLDTGFMGTVNGTRTALRRMRPRRSGAIVQVGAAAGERGLPLHTADAAVAAALRAFTEALRAELAQAPGLHIGIVHATRPPDCPPEPMAEAIWQAATQGRPEAVISQPRRQVWANWFGRLAATMRPKGRPAGAMPVQARNADRVAAGVLLAAVAALLLPRR